MNVNTKSGYRQASLCGLL